MPRDHSAGIAELAQLARDAVAGASDSLAALCHIVRRAADSQADPYEVMGVLIEGVAHVLTGRIPVESRAAAALAALRMLADRMEANGVSLP